MTTTEATEAFALAGHSISGGTRVELELRPARLPSGSWMTIPVVVTRGLRPGPTMWISAAIHGDEICGVEIIRQILVLLPPPALCGTLIAVPVVNVPGFASGDRYMPDRRDLNRCFPGSARGSLAARFAHLFMSEIVERCEIGIDYHTGSDHRRNLPQVRADLDDPRTAELAARFAAPVILHSRLRDGSLREAAVRTGSTALLYEGGEAWRFDRDAVDAGVAGTLRVMHHIGMLASDAGPPLPAPSGPTVEARSSRWLRSPMSGVARVVVELGEVIEPKQTVAVITDAVGTGERQVRSTGAAIVVGRNELPVVHQGDALVHLATPTSANGAGGATGRERR